MCGAVAQNKNGNAQQPVSQKNYAEQTYPLCRFKLKPQADISDLRPVKSWILLIHWVFEKNGYFHHASHLVGFYLAKI